MRGGGKNAGTDETFPNSEWVLAEFLRPLLRTVVNGEDHDPILLGFVGSYKWSVGNHQFSGPRHSPRPSRQWERRKLLYAGKDSQR